MVNFVICYHIWSKEPLMQARNDDDLHGGQGQQRSNTVNNICITSMIFGE